MSILHNRFTKGLIAGTIIGATVSMMFPRRRQMHFRKKMFGNGKSFMRTAGNLIENMVDMW